MPKWTITSNDNVTQCPWNCKDPRHEHYVGSYEMAVRYFGVDQGEISSWGDLFNVIWWHQTSGVTAPKLSNELFDILMSKQAEHKHWAPPSEREKRALDAIEEARKADIIRDEQLCANLQKLADSGNASASRRIYMFHKWKEWRESLPST